MKRHSFLLLLIAALMLLASCGQLAANSQTTKMPTPSAGPTAISADYAMLSGYGQDVLPLYESTRVTSCSFTLRFSGNEYTYGHATYQIQYESDALAQGALDCYQPVFTRVGSNYEDMIMGQIGGRPSNVSAYQEKGEPLDASLILGLTDEEEPAGNPYFDNYSAMVEVMGGDRNTPDSFAYTRYNNDYVYGERCDLNYLTTLTAEEFSDLYETAYGDRDEFSASGNECFKTCTFREGEYRCMISYTKPQYENSDALLSIARIKTIPRTERRARSAII